MIRFRTKLFFTSISIAAAFLVLGAFWISGQLFCLLSALICVDVGITGVFVQALTAKASPRPQTAVPIEQTTTPVQAKQLLETADTEQDIDFPNWQPPASLEPHPSLTARQGICSYDLALERFLSGRHTSDTLSLYLPTKLAEDTAETVAMAAMTY